MYFPECGLRLQAFVLRVWGQSKISVACCLRWAWHFQPEVAARPKQMFCFKSAGMPGVLVQVIPIHVTAASYCVSIQTNPNQPLMFAQVKAFRAASAARPFFDCLGYTTRNGCQHLLTRVSKPEETFQ